MKIKCINNGEKRIKIFGANFVKNNRGKIKIKINGKETELTEYYDNMKKENILEVKIIEIETITNMSWMFHDCSSLLSISDISKLNTSNVKYMNGMFCKCSSVISLPYISKWNTSNVKDMSWMFHDCSSLLTLPDISKWNTSKVYVLWMFIIIIIT